MSLLNHDTELAYPSSGFWSIKPPTTSCLNFPVIFSGILLITPRGLPSGAYTVFLTQKHLYFALNPQQILKAKISWSIIESFVEEEHNVPKYGFSVKSCKGYQDFYVGFEEELENWLQKLGTICILTGFDQDYVTIKKIDTGAYGSVTLCQDIQTGHEFAVKQFKKQLLTSSSHIKQLKKEIRHMRKLDSPLCIKLFRVYEDPENFFLVMEYLPHGNLLQRLEKLKKLSEYESALLTRQLFEVLFYLYTIGLVHRDIKLDNILMVSDSNNYEIKLIDFGLACRSSKMDCIKCGSAGFIAPEVLAGKNYDSKVDVFSVGVICYTVLTGKLPFYGKNSAVMLEKNEKCEVGFEKQDWKGHSSLALNFVKGVMNKDPDGRPNVEQALNHPWISRLVMKVDSDFSSVTVTDFNK